MQFDSPEFRLSKLHSDYANRTKPWWFLDMPHRDLKIVEFLRKSLNYIGRRTHFRKDVPNLWGGWSWFTWHRNIANYVLRQEKDNPSYFRRFHHTRCGDELIFATLLHPVSQKMNLETNNSLRYVNWNKKIPSRQTRPSAPLTLNVEEYDDIIQSCAFFSRKIDPVISKVLKGKHRENIRKENLQ